MDVQEQLTALTSQIETLTTQMAELASKGDDSGSDGDAGDAGAENAQGDDGDKIDDKGNGGEAGLFARMLARFRGGDDGGSDGADDKGDDADAGGDGDSDDAGAGAAGATDKSDAGQETNAQLGALTAEIVELKSRLGATDDAQRDKLLASLGVHEQARVLAPQVDVRTDEGKLELEKWAADNPIFTPGRKQAPPEPDWSKMGDPKAIGMGNEQLAAGLHKIDKAFEGMP